jgi:serine/threonine protein kinase
MPFEETMKIVRGMGKALAYAHERGFVHCDFKPANVILTETGGVKVIDFGIARVFQKAGRGARRDGLRSRQPGRADAGLRQPGNAGKPRTRSARRHLCARLHHLRAADRAPPVQPPVRHPGAHGAAHLKDTLAALPGVDTLTLQVEPLADDKCDTIKAFAPYWIHNMQAGHVAALHVRPPGGQLSEGNPLVVDVTTPGYDSYVNLDYYQLDGSVVHMVPSPRAKDNQAPPHYAATIGSAGDWIISKPFGSEMVVLLITPAPLFDKPRPESESRADYLRALDTRLAQIGGKYGHDHIVADFAPITTKPRSP